MLLILSLTEQHKPYHSFSFINLHIISQRPLVEFIHAPNHLTSLTRRDYLWHRSVINVFVSWTCSLSWRGAGECASVHLTSLFKHSFQQPTPISTIKRVTTIKILGIIISSNMSVTEHINNIIASSAQTIHAFCILRSHGMQTESTHTIYRAVVIAKLTYASSVWWGFTATDR